MLQFKISKRVNAFILLLLVLLLSGCWNRRELNTLGILGAVAVDMEGDKFKLTFEVFNPKGLASRKSGTATEEPVKYLQSTGTSMFDAFRNATLKFDRKIFWSHIRVYIFSEEIARKGLINYLDIFQRDHEIRKTIPILIARNSSAAEILSVKAGIGSTPSEYINDLLKVQNTNAKGVTIRLLDFLDTYYAEGIQPIAGVIEKKKKATIDPPQKKAEQNKEEYELTDEGTAVFLNEKMVGFLNGNETRGFNLVTGNVQSGIIVSPAPGGKGITSVEILRAESEKDVKINERKASIKVKIKITGSLAEETGKIALMRPEVMAKVEKASERAVKKEVEDTLKIVQGKYESDIFGFGELIHGRDPQKWRLLKKDWNKIFSHAKIKVQVKINIIKPGLDVLPANTFTK